MGSAWSTGISLARAEIDGAGGRQARDRRQVVGIFGEGWSVGSVVLAGSVDAIEPRRWSGGDGTGVD